MFRTTGPVSLNSCDSLGGEKVNHRHREWYTRLTFLALRSLIHSGCDDDHGRSPILAGRHVR